MKHIVYIVLGGVIGDSRVIKTAKSAERLGYRSTIVGLNKYDSTYENIIEGANVILVPNPTIKLAKQGLWPDISSQQIDLYLECATESILQVVEKIQPDLIHSHDMGSLRAGSSIARALAIKGKCIPWIHDVHEYVRGFTNIPQHNLEIYTYDEHCFLRQADAVLTVSQMLVKELQTCYKFRNPPEIVYNCPNYTETKNSDPDIRRKLNLSDSQKLIVYTGHVKKERGGETIVDAVATLDEDVHLCFVSDSSYLKTLKNHAINLGMKHRFHTLPFVSSDKVSSFIRTADVGIHALIHYPNGEMAMPNKLFEYLHADLPIVVSDVAEMKRFVEFHNVGQVFKAENVESCANAISACLKNKEKYQTNITLDLKTEYSWQRQEQKLGEVYKKAVQQYNTQETAPRLIAFAGDNTVNKSAANKNISVGYIGMQTPSESVDFYIDSEREGVKAGLISRLARRFSMFYIPEEITWFNAADLQALKNSGAVIHRNGSIEEQFSKYSNSPPSPDLNNTELRELETTQHKEDREFTSRSLNKILTTYDRKERLIFALNSAKYIFLKKGQKAFNTILGKGN